MGYEVGAAGYGGTNTAAVLVLFVLLVIVSLTFTW
ncbi:YjcZ family sporulation protein [Paenibacillus sp. N3.4]|nr:YjcZ family sporulation protein [Paenibacillus sp. N3.4]